MNTAGALLLQSTRPAGRVAELGSFGSPMKAYGLFRIAGLSLLQYLVLYLVLSLYGRYEPTIPGFWRNSYKPDGSFYKWAPYGFFSDDRWNRGVVAFYYPLLKIDQSLWHRS